MDKCKGFLCNDCSCSCQNCVICSNAEYAEDDLECMHTDNCEDYES